MKRLYILAVIVLVSGIACRDEFDADVQSQDQTFLVVEGNLNAGNDSTIIRLTRTFALDGNARLVSENNATLTVEGNDNTTRPLIPKGGGYYVSPNLNLVIGTQYRLRIRTIAGKEYLSEYVKARVTPPIDSINSEERDDGQLWIYANTHDPAAATRYYRWSFDETWEINSSFYSMYIYENGSVRPRNMPAEEVFYCWKYDTSKSVLLANSNNLTEDKIFRAPLTRIPFSNEKLSVRYSIQVRQYALDKDAYNFYEMMKKNTEEIGGIFTPQPSELKGNIKCTSDPAEYVLGFVTASTVDTKRIFVRLSRPAFSLYCPQKIVTTIPDSTDYYFQHGDYMPYDYNFNDFTYLSSVPQCVDCRERGGSLKRPTYW